MFGVSAAAGLFRRDLFDSVGLFDESFFAYQEDVDLALRARFARLRVRPRTGGTWRHVGHASNRPFPVAGTWADFFNARNRLSVLAKSVPGEQWRRSWRRIVMTQLGALVKSVPEGRWSAVLAGVLHGLCRLPFSVRARYRPIAAGVGPSSEPFPPVVSDTPQLSVVFITLDARAVLAAAIDSIPDGGEIVVADGGSSDGTGPSPPSSAPSRCAGSGGHSARRRGIRHCAQRRRDEARGEWILHLDADECLSPALAGEVLTVISREPEAVAYEIPRRNLFWGRPVRLLGPDYQLRLVRRGRGRFSGVSLHLRMQVDGTIGRLQSPLIHLNVRTWRDVIRRFRRDAPVQARALERRPRSRRVPVAAHSTCSASTTVETAPSGTDGGVWPSPVSMRSTKRSFCGRHGGRCT